MESCKDIIKAIRKRAKVLREDTLVSMNESIANSVVAEELEYWANKLEAVSPNTGKA